MKTLNLKIKNVTLAEAASNNSKVDWDLKRQKIKDDAEARSEFWKSYYNTEWGNFSDYVKSLGPVFTTELLNLGFTSETNPFVKFLHLLTSTRANPTSGENILNNPGSSFWSKNLYKVYPAIHNAYIRNYITEHDLSTLGINPNNANILFSSHLSSLSAFEVLNLLELQHKIEKLYKVNIKNYIETITDPKTKALFEKTFTPDDLGLHLFIIQCFYSNKQGTQSEAIQSPEAYLSKYAALDINKIKHINSNIITAADKAGTLRPASQVLKILTKTLALQVQKKSSMQDSEISSFSDKLKKVIGPDIIPFAAYLSIIFNLNNKLPGALKKILNSKGFINLNSSNIETFNNIIEKYELTPTQALILITALLSKK